MLIKLIKASLTLQNHKKVPSQKLISLSKQNLQREPINYKQKVQKTKKYKIKLIIKVRNQVKSQISNKYKAMLIKM
jgi:hypothetical protein